MPYFEGSRYQQYGRGLGGILSGLFRKTIMPMASRVGKQLVKAGAKRAQGVLRDVSRGRTLKSALKKQSSQIIPSLIEGALNVAHQSTQPSTPTQRKRRRVQEQQLHPAAAGVVPYQHPIPATRRKRTKKAKRVHDIFDD